MADDAGDTWTAPRKTPSSSWKAPMNDCVWICSTEGRAVWCQNLGPFEPAATVMANWLGQNAFGE
jgi:hypothetical protein